MCVRVNLKAQDDDRLAEYLWPIVREIAKTAIENGQNLIIEGCYVPFEWRRDFDERYLASIRFICLAMTDASIDAHFEEILQHASDIEARLDDSGCTPESLKADNRIYREGFSLAGDQVTLIDGDYEESLNAIL